MAATEVQERITDLADRKVAEKAANYGPEIMRMAEKSLLLQLLDQTWKDHLLSLDHLRQGINLRAYAQKDPLNEYKREAFELFQHMLVHLRETFTQMICHLELRFNQPETFQPPPPVMLETREDPALQMSAYEIEERATGTMGRVYPMPVGGPASGSAKPVGQAGGGSNDAGNIRPFGIDPENPATWSNTARNALCPCGSGRKYKHCHGRI